MSNRQFSLTISADEIIENVPKRSRSKFASDAILVFSKKKGIMEQYITKEYSLKNQATNDISAQVGHSTAIEINHETPLNAKLKKVKIDDGFSS